MSDANYSAPVKDLGDKIVALSLLQAKELSDYLKNVYGLEAAPAAAVTMAAAGRGAPRAQASRGRRGWCGWRGRRREDRIRRRAGKRRREEDRRHQGCP